MKRRLSIGKNQSYALRERQGNVITNRDEIVTIAEEFYRGLYSSRDNQDNSERGSSLEEDDVPPVLTEEVVKALKEMLAEKHPVMIR